MKLVCIPYAGGSAMMFDCWRDKLQGAEIVQLELPGRGLRFKDKNAESMEALAADLTQHLMRRIGDEPYILLGFCYGAIVGYSMVQYMAAEGITNRPKAMILLSSLPPGMHSTAELIFTMPNYKLVKYLLQSIAYDPGETTAENSEIFRDVFSIVNPELTEELRKMESWQIVMSFLFPKGEKGAKMQSILNVMKADAKLMSEYDGASEPVPLDMPVYSFHGKSDEIVRLQDVEGWRDFCTGAFHAGEVIGGHMMLFDSQTDVLDRVQEIVNEYA